MGFSLQTKLIAGGVLFLFIVLIVWNVRGWKEDHGKLKTAVATVAAQQAAQSSQHSADTSQATVDAGTASDAAKKLQEEQATTQRLRAQILRLQATGQLTQQRHEEPANAATPMVTVRTSAYRLCYNAAVSGTAESGVACSQSGLLTTVPSQSVSTP